MYKYINKAIADMKLVLRGCNTDMRIDDLILDCLEEHLDIEDKILDIEKEAAWHVWEKFYKEKTKVEFVPFSERLAFDMYWMKHIAGRCLSDRL